MKKKLKILVLLTFLLFSSLAMLCQQPALLVQRFFTNPAGTDAPNEFAELVATRTIDFAANPYTIVFTDGSNAGTAGWASGGTGSYAFEINSGLVQQGDLVYVGGTGMTNFINGGSSCKILRQINTLTNAGDHFGSASGACLGNGGNTADGIAVFNTTAASIIATSIPIDAVFFGSAIGSAANKFTTPINDHYAGGIFGTAGNTFLAPDPGGDEYVLVQSGSFNSQNYQWITARVWTKNTTKPACTATSPIIFSSNNNLVINFHQPSTPDFLQPPVISAVLNDPTDPALYNGFLIDITENNLPLSGVAYTLSANSSNSTVVHADSILLLKQDGSARIKIKPQNIGYSNLQITVRSETGNQQTLPIQYAVSAAAEYPAETRWHTGISDASDAIVLDSNYFITADDEQNILNVYNRNYSGLPLISFNYANSLNLPDGPLEEVDVEAAAQSPLLPTNVYWIGSMSNGKSPNFNSKPNRNTLFATNITGTGSATQFAFAGSYGNLRNYLINWGNTYGYNFSACAAAGVDAKSIAGFAIEGMVFGPDKTSLYIAFRAPLVPANNRTNAVIAPIANFETWFNNGQPIGAPTLLAPIELSLGGRGIRDLVQLSNGAYIIVAGNPAGNPVTSALYMWTGYSTDTPVMLTNHTTGLLNLEGVMEVQENNLILGNQLQLISDGGSDVYYLDNIEAKDLAANHFKKFRTDKIQFSGNWNYIFNGTGNWDNRDNWQHKIVPPTILPAPQTITINNQPQGACFLNIPKQIIAAGAALIVATGSNLQIPAILNIQ